MPPLTESADGADGLLQHLLIELGLQQRRQLGQLILLADVADDAHDGAPNLGIRVRGHVGQQRGYAFIRFADVKSAQEIEQGNAFLEGEGSVLRGGNDLRRDVIRGQQEPHGGRFALFAAFSDLFDLIFDRAAGDECQQ